MLRTALAGSGPYYDVVPVNPRYTHSHRGLPVTRRFAQGGGSALLAFAGADSMTANAAATSAGSAPTVDLSLLDGIAASIFSGGLTGPVQIAAAVLLFVAAGKCISRFAGLAAVAGLYFLHTQGVTLGEATNFVMNFGERAASAVEAFKTAKV